MSEKSTPDPDRAATEPTDGAPEERRHTSPRWYRTAHLPYVPAYISPLIPLWSAVKTYTQPNVMVRMPDDSTTGLHGDRSLRTGGTHVTHAVTELPGLGVADRVTLAAPALLIAVALAAACWIIYRTAGDGHRFTGRERAVTLGAILFTSVGVTWGSVASRLIAEDHVGVNSAQVVGQWSSGTEMGFVFMVALITLCVVHQKGKRAHDELAEVF